LRAEEKMIQREREIEGDEFKDKEAFVTQAYKDQMAEVRRAEEEEKQREGMSHILLLRLWLQLFYRGREEEEQGTRHWYGTLLQEVA
jgi:hypothetical protein